MIIRTERRPALGLAGLGLAVLLAMLLAGCRSPSLPPGAPVVVAAPQSAAAAADTKCRVGEGGAPVMAIQSADRGIGGTGISGGGPQLADRGIGGTGIVGTITGFASICLNGVEVGLDRTAPVESDGQDAVAADLRAGQQAVIEAAGDPARLAARRIAIRHEVSGPIERVDAEPGSERRVLLVAGQLVLVPGPVWGDRDVAVGDWVAVSGVRRFDGSIEATRLDRRPPGRVLVHGRLITRGGGLFVGALLVQSGFDLSRHVGRFVTVTGSYKAARLPGNAGIVSVETIAPDLLASDPVAYFGPAVQFFIVEDYIEIDGGRARFARGTTVGGASGFAGREPGRGVLSFQRQGPQGLTARGFEPTGRSTGGWMPDSFGGRPFAGNQPLASPAGRGSNQPAGTNPRSPGASRRSFFGNGTPTGGPFGGSTSPTGQGYSGQGSSGPGSAGPGASGQSYFPGPTFGPGYDSGAGRPRSR